MTMQEKQILKWATGIQKENWGLQGIFLKEIIKQLTIILKSSKMQSNVWPWSFAISEKCVVTPKFSF